MPPPVSSVSVPVAEAASSAMTAARREQVLEMRRGEYNWASWKMTSTNVKKMNVMVANVNKYRIGIKLGSVQVQIQK